MMTEYYKGKMEAALEYQDFVADQLRKADPCIIIGPYSSRKWQIDHGESASGIEIKYDMKKAETGNLYIEVAEKSRPEMPDYTPSGIMRDDNSWLYLIGDYDEAYLFSKKQLQNVYADSKSYPVRGIKRVQTATSIGILIPTDKVMGGMCLRRFDFKK